MQHGCWSPSLGELEARLPGEADKLIARFLVGGLIFAAYAKKLGGAHMMQPKRSRLFIAAALMQSPVFELEEALFAELKGRANSPFLDLPWRPTFFPYLLSRADTPLGVLSEAIELRKTSMVADYRDWLIAAEAEWRRDGVIAARRVNEVKSIAEAFDHLTGRATGGMKIEIKAVLGLVPAVAFDPKPLAKGLWGWYLAHTPGHDHRKLLMRALLADSTYRRIDARIRTVWDTAEGVVR